MDKAVLTNLVALVIVIIGLFLPTEFQALTLNIGLFALSGAFTNWLAVHMLFEKVPGFYGSGVIPARFEEFKHGIKTLIMGQFFTPSNIEQFLSGSLSGNDEEQSESFVKKMTDKVDFSAAYDSLVDVIMESSFAGMLSMLGGAEALKPLREPFINKMRDFLSRLADDKDFLQQFQKSAADNLLAKVEGIVEKRLDELTPELVKEIIQQMIKKHLGWLVVWGGVIGGLIGLVVSLFL
ncbi:MAG: DUF445 domain-containing protein [SAR86 cluster bacterium]|uniref:DUF445 domain-containing protein n=1 Tax=SAR86 cluster bacterium TaxID=2030880 RepID=A0A2A5CHU6_9GAMM|nr:MAG: DUF445 domain-containing protein [SAR86 cluster bacterium]